MKKLLIVVSVLTCMGGAAVAGSIDSPGAPGSAASKMPALGEVYTYLTTGTPVPTPGTGFTEPSAGPASTGRTLTEIYNAVATPFPQCDATAADVNSGKKFFCTAAGSWGVQTGTLTAVGELLKTGQTIVYETGDDGSYQKGIAFNLSAGGDNTVIDSVTGLQWQAVTQPVTQTWSEAITWAEALVQDGKSDWRLPNIKELQTLHIYNSMQGPPFINKTMFPNVVAGTYWSSTTTPYSADYALRAHVSSLGAGFGPKTNNYYAWAVRGGI